MSDKDYTIKHKYTFGIIDGAYTDDSICPIGIYKGKKLRDISMYQLGKLRDWLYDKKLAGKYSKLIAYIEDNEETV